MERLRYRTIKGEAMGNSSVADIGDILGKLAEYEDLEETITPFNTLHELYDKCKWLDWIVPETLVLYSEPYGTGNNMVLLWGQYQEQLGTNKAQPCGFVTANVTRDMKTIEYINE